MANTLLPIEERNLTPDQVELLDKRRRRGQLFLVLCLQTFDHRHSGDAVGWAGLDTVAGVDAPDGVLGCDNVYAFADLRRCRGSAEARKQRVHQLLSRELRRR